MEKIEIQINGKAYPCRQTMGAMLRFKQQTGRDVTEMDGGITDVCTFLWCCISSACKADGVEFGMSLMEFADSLSPEEMRAWDAAAHEEKASTGGGDEKKSR